VGAGAFFALSRSRARSKNRARKREEKSAQKSESAERERKKREFVLFPPPTVKIREGKDHSLASLNQNLTALNFNR
jgi:hypothetical protein